MTQSQSYQNFYSNVNQDVDYTPPYGDVTELNTCRLILDSVGKETLKDIAKDSIDLLETSVAIYEKNGDYAIGIFASGWCRLMDDASRQLCNTEDNHEALTCGKWLCHENCWNDAGKTTINSGESTDIECVGGINLYAAPIYANDQVVGSINIGYGTPPKDPEKIRELSRLYQVSEEKLLQAAQAYQPRPQSLIDLAKKRLSISAKLIGKIVAQAMTEQALKESEEQFRNIYENMSVGVAQISMEFQIECANEAYCHMLGYTEQELIGRGLKDITHPEILEENLQKQSQLARGEIDHYRMEKKFIHKNGGVVYGILNANLVRDVKDDPLYMIGSVVDITERRQLEQELKEQKNLLESIINGIPDILAIQYPDHSIERYNQAGYQILNLSPEEVRHKKCFQLIGRDSECEQCATREALRTGKLEQLEKYVPELGIYLDCRSNPVLDEDGNAVRIIEQLRDITERKKAEEELKAAHDKLDSVVELNADGLMVLDPEGIILFLNPAAAEMLGREQGELLGEQFGHPLIPGSNTEIELLSTSGEPRVVELRAREAEWSGQDVLLVSFRDITERKRAEEKIYYLAYYDDLTGLPNRRLFYDRLEKITARSEHFGHGCTVFLMDITRLREVNDTLGQQAGDELIMEVARRISDTVFEEDTVARGSGGEFMVLSEGRSADERARNLGVRILERIGWNLELSGRLVYPEVNMGFTLFPDWGTDPDTLIKQADIALSEAKKSVSRIQEFTGQEDWISRQFHLEHDLKQALVNEEFFLCYQSQIDLRTGRIVGLEALLRWKHPQKGVVSPGEFTPVLEQTGMIASADAWVIHRVCEQLRSWQEEGIFVKTSVNLSAQEITDDATKEVVRAALEENSVRARSLEVEITETGLMENVDRASRILQIFSSWGVGVALDDFGKGYSSLSYLQKLPINIIKIDKQFVDGLPENQDSVIMVQTIIAMAHNLDKKVLAEGVETEEQRLILYELGCDYGQGFLWSRPKPAEELTW